MLYKHIALCGYRLCVDLADVAFRVLFKPKLCVSEKQLIEQIRSIRMSNGTIRQESVSTLSIVAFNLLCSDRVFLSFPSQHIKNNVLIWYWKHTDIS